MKRFTAMLALLICAGCSTGPSYKVSAPPDPDAAPKDQRITVEFNRADLKKAVEMIARWTRLAILYDNAVQGTVTMAAQDRPVGEVLEEIVRSSNGRVVFVRDNLIRIVPQ